VRYLLDTCVVCEAVLPRPNPRVVEFLRGLAVEDVALSVLTVGEIRRGIEQLPASRRRAQLEHWFNQTVLRQFATLDLNVAIALAWGRLTARLEARGRVLPVVDAWLAATALTEDLTIVTRNEDDFAGTGVTVRNPWRE
jgi:predicted nucleic acid-binding protein